jgi:RND family efflux transporter MFP subunit
MNTRLVILILFAAGLMTACGKSDAVQQTPDKGESIPVKVASLKKGTLSSPILASGNFTTNEETLLSFKTGGIVQKVNVEEGEAVKKGQVLATLVLTEVQSGLNQAKLGFEKAQRDYERAERLYQDSVATLEQFQNSKTALEIARQQLNTAEFNLTYSQIRATEDGFVLRKFVNDGQQVSSGSPVLQTNGTASNSWKFKATVNDANWSRIALEDSATVSLGSDEDLFIPGKITRKSQAADPVSGAYWVEVQFEKPDSINLASGMFGRSTIYPTAKTEGWQIPYSSLLDAQGDEGFVFVTDDQKSAKKVVVKLGKISNETVQVISGLENFPYLIISGSAYLNDQSPIQIQE